MKKKTITSTGTAINANDLSEEEYQSEIKVDTEEGQMYHPLDMVNLVDYSSGFPIHIQVPVIFVKALASEAELKDINRNIRIGFDFLAIMAGLAIAFTTANPGALALALADITLATGDVAVQDAVKELEKTPEGREFLETWEKIYMVGGVLLAGPALIETVMIKGARLLNFVKTTTSAKFLKTCLLKVLLEIEIANFTKNTVKEIIYGEEALRSSGISFNFAGITRLQEQGVLFIKGIGFDDKVVGYAAVYKGEAIAVGTAKEVREALKELWTTRGVKLAEKLNDLYDVASFVSRYAVKLKTNINEAFFWSGRSNGIGGEKIALEIALSKNGITLEGLISKNNIPMPKWEDNPKIWSAISKKYASLVEGEVRGVIGKRLRKINIWETRELPTLMTNPKVTKITIIDPESGIEKIIKK